MSGGEIPGLHGLPVGLPIKDWQPVVLKHVLGAQAGVRQLLLMERHNNVREVLRVALPNRRPSRIGALLLVQELRHGQG